MCGITVYKGILDSEEKLMILKQVLIESRIRGRHASGIAWSEGRALHSVVKPIPIDELVREFNWETLFNKQISLIGHARYSTSDIRYNQPIVGENIAIAMNGVITQSDPKTWKNTYGYNCITKNDSELLLRALEAGDDPFKVFPNSSIAYVSIDSLGHISYDRNGLRPLWSGTVVNDFICSSTYDILKRSGVTNITKILTNNDDLQRRDSRIWEKKRKTT